MVLTTFSGIPPRLSYAESNYAINQNTLLRTIGSAQRFALVATTDFQDGEIASALILSHYRGVKTHVILSAEGAKQWESRVSFLRKNGVPTHILDDSLFQKTSVGTILFTEKNVLALTCPLASDNREPCYNGRIRLPPSIKEQWVDAFRTFFKQVPSQIQHLPNASVIAPSPKAMQPADFHAGYRYTPRKQHQPQNLPTQLPKSTIWQKKDK